MIDSKALKKGHFYESFYNKSYFSTHYFPLVLVYLFQMDLVYCTVMIVTEWRLQ